MSVYYIVLAGFLLFMALVPFNAGQQYIDDDIEVVSSCQNGYVQNAGCDQNSQVNIIITATLDGVVTALDGETGEMIWRYEDAPLLRGTLSTSDPIDIGGTSLQLMPTLDGRLFSYTHNTNLIEPLPITTDSLLESTIRLGQDAVAGGKSVTTKGFDLFTGEQKYECSMESCGPGDTETPKNPIILIRRTTNSIRAMDTLRGIERWNLSTAEIGVTLAGGITSPTLVSDVKILLQPPDGVIVAVDKYNREEWKTNVDGHIVSVWQVYGNQIGEISIFDPSNIFTTQYEVMQREQHNLQTQSSLLYMGTSNGFPFIIQSPKAKNNLKQRMNALPELSTMTELTNPRFCTANEETRSLAYNVKDETLRLVLHNAFRHSQSKAIEDKSLSGSSARRKLQIIASDTEVSAQRIGTENLRSTSVSKSGDYGYLVLESEPQRVKFKVNSPITLMQTIFSYIFNPTAVVSFLAGLIGVTVAVVYNKIAKSSPRMIEHLSSTESAETESASHRTRTTSFAPTDDEIERFVEEGSDLSTTPIGAIHRKPLMPIEKSNIETHTQPQIKPVQRLVKTDIDTDEDSFSNDEKKRLLRNRTISRSSLEGFTSRFANEFEVKKVIGHGGFGVVFRAQSITDMNEYAVKRIAVADNDKARNRVLREARALAMFDHPGIIRYFYAWEERPPKGFQEKEDENLLGKIKAEKLAKLHEIKKAKKHTSEGKRVRSADTASFAESFAMPPVVGNTTDAENSWSTSAKPQEVGAKRTTSESKLGLHGGSDRTTAELKEESVAFSESDEESDTTEDSSSSDESPSSSSGSSIDDEPKKYNSSSGGIEFVDGSDDVDNEAVKETKKEIAVIEELSIHNRAMIVETENQELEVRERNDTGDCAYLYIVMQLCAEKTLEDWIRRSKTMESRPLFTMKNWIKQLASGLEYLHNKGFIHRDLKPGNVFFSLDSTHGHQILKIGDLGLATKTDGAPKITVRQDSDSSAKHTKNVGTRSYMSPEQLKHQQYTEKVDIFALGLVATELIISFSTASERIHTFADFQKGDIPAILDNVPESRDFLLQLTSLEPSERPTAHEVATHKFLQ